MKDLESRGLEAEKSNVILPESSDNENLEKEKSTMEHKIEKTSDEGEFIFDQIDAKLAAESVIKEDQQIASVEVDNVPMQESEDKEDEIITTVENVEDEILSFEENVESLELVDEEVNTDISEDIHEIINEEDNEIVINESKVEVSEVISEESYLIPEISSEEEAKPVLSNETEDTVDDKKEIVDETISSDNPDQVEEDETVDDLDLIDILDSDDSDNDDEEVIEKVDYSQFNKEELINILSDKLENLPVSELKSSVDNIKAVFYKKYKLEIEELRKAFMAEGGDPAEFVFEVDPLEETFKELLNKYKSLKADFNKNIELEKENNLKMKYVIIEEIKALINGQESLNKTFNDFHELQNRWKEIGLVPQADVNNMWENYHHCVEQFYDYVKINRELRDLDFRKNLDSKILICEKANHLLLEPSVVKAFKGLQKLHDEWKEIGPVPNEKREEIWERFKDTTAKINKAHQDYFEGLKDEQNNNFKAKVALCEKAEEIANENIVSHNDWDSKSNEIIELQKLWKTIGFATKKENNKVYERFRIACDLFFTNKRDFFKASKNVQNDNLQMKTELCLQAESLKDSNEWKKTTEELIQLQKKWKEIGPVPRKTSDIIWKRFRAACNEFFDKKEKYFSNIDSEYDENLKKKRELIERAKNFQHLDEMNDNLNSLNEIQKEWTLIGHVPFKFKDSIQKEFRDAINAQFDSLKIDSVKRSVYVYRQKIDNLAEGTNTKRNIRVEKDKILEKIRQLESDINLLENNIGFFAKTKGAEGLIKDVNIKIENAKTQVKIEKQKLDMLTKVDM